MILLLANISTFTGALIFFVFGIVYLYKSKSLSNNCNTVQKKLAEVNGESKILIFALMRGAGGGAIAVAALTFWLQWQYLTRTVAWIPLSIVIDDLLFYLPSLNATSMVKRKTTVKPPVFLLSLAMLLIILGYFLNIQTSNG